MMEVDDEELRRNFPEVTNVAEPRNSMVLRVHHDAGVLNVDERRSDPTFRRVCCARSTSLDSSTSSSLTTMDSNQQFRRLYSTPSSSLDSSLTTMDSNQQFRRLYSSPSSSLDSSLTTMDSQQFWRLYSGPSSPSGEQPVTPVSLDDSDILLPGNSPVGRLGRSKPSPELQNLLTARIHVTTKTHSDSQLIPKTNRRSVPSLLPPDPSTPTTSDEEALSPFARGYLARTGVSPERLSRVSLTFS